MSITSATYLPQCPVFRTKFYKSKLICNASTPAVLEHFLQVFGAPTGSKAYGTAAEILGRKILSNSEDSYWVLLQRASFGARKYSSCDPFSLYRRGTQVLSMGMKLFNYGKSSKQSTAGIA